MFIKSLTCIWHNYQNLLTNNKLQKSRHHQHNFYCTCPQSITIIESKCLDNSSSLPGPLITIKLWTQLHSVCWIIEISSSSSSHPQSDLDRLVSASSNSLFKHLPSCVHPTGLLFCINFGILFSSFLLHVLAYLICIILVSHQLVLLSALP